MVQEKLETDGITHKRFGVFKIQQEREMVVVSARLRGVVKKVDEREREKFVAQKHSHGHMIGAGWLVGEKTKAERGVRTRRNFE